MAGNWYIARITCLAGLLLAMVWAVPATAQDSVVPEFRQISKVDVSSAMRRVRSVRFAIDETMPPFAYRNADGALTGFVPLLLNALCMDLKLRCEFIPRSRTQVIESLDKNEADAVLDLTGPDAADLSKHEFTRPFLRSFGRFAIRTGSPLEETSQRALAGKRIGVRAGTRQQQFIEQFYPRSAMIAFDSHQELYEALRTARIDLLFDDALRLMFWLQADTARDCCQFLGRGYGAGTGVSQSMSFAVRKQDGDLRKMLDYGLDRLQSSGRFAAIYGRFFPASPY